MLLKPLNEDMQNKYKHLYIMLKEHISAIQVDTKLTMHEWLQEIGMDMDTYIATIQSQVSKLTIFLKHEPKYIYPNAFNKKTSFLW